MRIRAIDTETFLIGPGAIAPKLVCLTIAERMPDGQIATQIYGNGDREELLEALWELFQVDGNMLVGHSVSYDLTVIATSYPEIEPLIWAKLEAGEITCTMLRERLLNLSRHGKLDMMPLPDGSTKQIRYQLSDLVLAYLGLDIKASKEGEDIWRLRYHELDGYPAAKYPKEARDYAIDDVILTIQVYECQDQVPDGSMVTEAFQTAADFALACMTLEGMPVDPVKFREVEAMLARELSEDNMAPLIATGIITAPEPARPHANQLKKAVGLVAQWTGDTRPTADKILEFREELEASGVKFKAPEPSHLKTAKLQHRVLACLVSRETDNSVEDLWKMPFEELVALADSRGIKFNKTPGGDVSTASEVIDDVEGDCEVMSVFAGRQALQKLVTTELPRMTWNGEPAARVHFRFNALVETGRTSSRAEKLYPSGNGQNVDPRARPIHVPPPGYLLCSTDYSTLELVCVGQVTLDKFGRSVHAEKINAGYDLHAYLGSALATALHPTFRENVQGLSRDDAYEFFKLLKNDPATEKMFKHWRKFAKPIGLGFPGGLGPFKMLTLAKKTYGVDIVAEAVARFEQHPEEFDRLNPSVLYYAKKLYGMDDDDSVWTPTLKGIALARRLKDIWLDTYPEMVEFFNVLNSARKAKSREDGDDSASDDFEYTTPFGMVRKGCSYTSAANGECMQSPAAEGFKSACFNLVRATRDPNMKSALFRPAAFCPNEIHDETLTFLREADAPDLAMEVKQIMEDSMRLVIRDVKVKAEPCLMRRWFKEAEPVYQDGKLVPWEPKPAP